MSLCSQKASEVFQEIVSGNPEHFLFPSTAKLDTAWVETYIPRKTVGYSYAQGVPRASVQGRRSSSESKIHLSR